VNPIPWARVLAGLALVVASLGLVIFAFERIKADGAAGERVARTEERAAAQHAADVAIGDNKRESARREFVMQETVHVTESRLASAAAAASAADARARGLRQQLAVAAARSAAPLDPAASPECAADHRAVGVLAELLGQADEFAGEVARDADASRIRGASCERSYDVLTNPETASAEP